MTQAERYSEALRRATRSDTLTEWVDERHDIPAIRDDDRAVCERWLWDIKFLYRGHKGEESQNETWEKIKANWISFLSATSLMPDEALTNREKDVVGRSRNGKFEQERTNRKMTQAAIWAGLDGIESLTERWPCVARVAMNSMEKGGTLEEFKTLAAKWDVAKRRRYQAIWTSLLGFLLHSFNEGTVQEMGLKLTEGYKNEIKRVVREVGYIVPGKHRRLGALDGLWTAVETLLMRALKQKKSTARNNPMIWWIGILVRSALSSSSLGGGTRNEDYISWGRFNMNPMPMDVDLTRRVEAFIHYSKVLALNDTFMNWNPTPRSWILQVQSDLNLVDNEWLNNEHGTRPLPAADRRKCTSYAWQSVLSRVEDQTKELCGGKGGTALHTIRSLEGNMIGREATRKRKRGQTEISRSEIVEYSWPNSAYESIRCPTKDEALGHRGGRVAADTSDVTPLFGRRTEPSSMDNSDVWRVYIKFLDDYRARKSDFALECRLTDILQTVEWWSLAGCTLCFASTGDLQPDHTMASCTRETDRERALAVLRWLESLSIPRSSSTDGRGFCSLCVAFHPCREVAIGNRAGSASSPGEKDYWGEEYRSKAGPDGHCERKPIVRQVIAALVVYDDFFLGRLMTNLASDEEGVDLTIGQQARKYFEEQVPFKDSWFPKILLAYEALVLSFYYRRNIQRQAPPLLGFPHQPAGLAPLPTKTEPAEHGIGLGGWNDVEELNSWESSLEWWVGKCGFCAGRGLRGSQIKHKLRQCTRGGKSKLRSELSEAMYEEGMLPSNGCDRCHLPHDLCNRWMRGESGEWVLVVDPGRQCKYDVHLLSDAMIGLYHCGKSDVIQDLLEQVEEYCVGEERDVTFDEETVACFLSQDITVNGVQGSEMIRQLAVMTRLVWHAAGKDQ